MAPFAPPVGASFEAFLSPGEVGLLGAGLGEEGGDLGPFEADGRAFGVVFVVGVGQLGPFDDVVEVAAQSGDAGGGPLLFRGQQSGQRGVFRRVHAVCWGTALLSGPGRRW